MRKSVTKIVLEKLNEWGIGTLDAFFPQKYSYTSSGRYLFGLDKYPKVKPQTLRAILSRLQKQGLVTRLGERNKSCWKLTEEGKKLFEDAEVYKVPKSDGVARLIIYDVPERERKKRDIMREHLMACNFKQLQKSVWIGYNPLPKDFIDFLDNLEMKQKVHIFSVLEKGTLV